jgi:predicted ATPase/DNA-binding XRE family transcriptional regulator
MDERLPFGARLRQLRLAAGLTHEALAELSGLCPRTISDLERGVSRAPRAASVALLSDALRLSDEQRMRLRASANPAPSATAPATNSWSAGRIPAPLTSFIGRARELQALRRLLQRDAVRLVTVTGAGGTGKTRLAVQLATQLRGACGVDIRYVALAAVTRPDDVPRAIAQALDAPESTALSPVERLRQALQDRDALLLLDNCEHVLDAAPLVLELLQDCPRLRVLATSRAALRLSGEQEFPLLPLPTPTIEAQQRLDRLGTYAVVRLFVERAQRVAPGFALCEANAAAIAAICARLDGLPLAIELAAARVKLLPPLALLERLTADGAALELLTGGARDLPPRQRTLRDTIDWSYALLTPAEQDLFRQVAVFVDGWTLDAMQAVCAVASERPPAFDLLASLLDKNLIYQRDGADGARRFCMLETIRVFALEQLAARDESASLFARHAEYYLALSASNGALLFAARPAQLRAVAEQGNLLAALHWWMRHG